MRRNRTVQKFPAAFFVFLALPILASAQAANIQARITQPVDDTILAVLRGNTHPLARAEFDRGAAPAGMPLHRMLLSLKRSPAQESALQQLLIDLQDKSSLNYHKWLTPAQFGQQFGPGRPMDRAIDTAAAKQRRIRRVDDGVNAQCGDVGNNDFQPRRANLAHRQAQAVALIATPLSANSCCNSPAWNISRMMSQPPTNSPLT